MLSDKQIERYSRQIILPQVGGKGQEKLLRARVLVHGEGALLSAALPYLAAAGLGTIGIVPHSSSPFHNAQDSSLLLGQVSALSQLNPDCLVTLHSEHDLSSPEQLVQDYDLTLSTSDFLHDACWETKRPFFYAFVNAEEAWLMSCRGYEADFPCLRCSSLPVSLQRKLSSLMEIVALFLGAQLATEAIKDLLHLPRSLRDVCLRFQIPLFHCTEEVVRKSSTCTMCCASL